MSLIVMDRACRLSSLYKPMLARTAQLRVPRQRLAVLAQSMGGPRSTSHREDPKTKQRPAPRNIPHVVRLPKNLGLVDDQGKTPTTAYWPNLEQAPIRSPTDLQERIDNMKEGAVVKVVDEDLAEGFWVEVLKRLEDGRYVGVVGNDLGGNRTNRNKPLTYGKPPYYTLDDLILVSAEEVWCVEAEDGEPATEADKIYMNTMIMLSDIHEKKQSGLPLDPEEQAFLSQFSRKAGKGPSGGQATKKGGRGSKGSKGL